MPQDQAKRAKSESYNPRWWVLGAGLWILSCYALIILAIFTGNAPLGILAFLAIAPVGLLWRIIYFITRKTPYINVKKRGFYTGIGPTRDEYDEIVEYEKKTGISADDNPFDKDIKKRAKRDADAEERIRAGFTGQLFRHMYNLSWGAMAVMYFYPIKDAFYEFGRWRKTSK